MTRSNPDGGDALTRLDSTGSPATFDRIIEELFDHTPAARLLYLRLHAAAVSSEPLLTQRALRERTHLGDTTVREQLTALEEAGWIVCRDDPRDPRCNVYEVVRTPDRD